MRLSSQSLNNFISQVMMFANFVNYTPVWYHCNLCLSYLLPTVATGHGDTHTYHKWQLKKLIFMFIPTIHIHMNMYFV